MLGLKGIRYTGGTGENYVPSGRQLSLTFQAEDPFPDFWVEGARDTQSREYRCFWSKTGRYTDRVKNTYFAEMVHETTLDPSRGITHVKIHPLKTEPRG